TVGDTIVRANGKSLAGKTSAQSTALIKAPAGSSVTLKTKDGRTLNLKRAKVDVPVVESKLETAKNGKKIGWVSLAGFTTGSGDDVKNAVDKEVKAGAKGTLPPPPPHPSPPP